MRLRPHRKVGWQGTVRLARCFLAWIVLPTIKENEMTDHWERVRCADCNCPFDTQEGAEDELCSDCYETRENEKRLEEEENKP
jgi:protein-arginine kinase activator protein McsA